MKSFVPPLLFTCACLFVSAGSVSLAADPAQHPELTAEEQYIPCADCHQDATPEVHEQWFDSVHGIAMVKCYQCHGTFETFRVTPPRENCAVCHADMMNKCPQDKTCWQCHIPHGFQAEGADSMNSDHDKQSS